MTDPARPTRAGAVTLTIAVALIALTACDGSKKAAAAPSTTSSVPATSSATAATSAIASSSVTSTSESSTATSESAASSSTTSSPGASSSGATASGAAGGGAKCTDLTDAAASAAIGKKVTVTATPITPLAGLSICNVTEAGEVYPIQLAVDSVGAAGLFAADQQAFSGVSVSGLGDRAFRSSIGVEALSGGVDIKVTGPAGPVLSNDFRVPTALVKAMIAAIH